MITPCRNEAEYARRSLESVVRQTVQPTKWIIVDDGSSDDTPRLLAEYAEAFPYIEIVTREDRGRRSVGPGVIESFYAGYQGCVPGDYDYLCKLDLDVELPEDYFEMLIARMEANPRLGTCSGKPYIRGSAGRLMPEPGFGDEMSVGATKFYRVRCFEQIGGFVRDVMWDGIDCHRCRMLGWVAASWDHPRFLHLRPMGSSDQSVLMGRLRHGRGQYFMGTGLIYITLSAMYRMTKPPLVLGGVWMLAGYVDSLIRRRPRYGDDAFRRFLRGYQRQCLIFGKRRATRRVEARLEPLWNPEARCPAASERSSAEAVSPGSIAGDRTPGSRARFGS